MKYMSNWVGQQLGNYRLIRQIGRGSFGQVYLSEHIYLKTHAAIKLVLEDVHGVKTKVFRSEFLQEAQRIASLKHPHILRVLEFGMENATPYLVMEYAVHGTLLDRHPRGSWVPVEQVVSYTKQIAQALYYAHRSGLIHRDIKPANVLLDEHDVALLSDFGIATIVHHTSSMQTGAYAGTSAYMAPEQLQGKPVPASDQYALAIMIYEWLCGQLPYQGNPIAVGIQHLTAPIPSLRIHDKTLSPTIEAVIHQAMAKDPKQRFATVLDFADALEQAHQEKYLTTPVSSTTQVRPPRHPSLSREYRRIPTNSPHTTIPPRSKVGIISGVVVFILILGVVSTFSLLAARGDNHSKTSTTSFTVPTVRPTTVPTATPLPVQSCGGAFSDAFNGNLRTGWNWIDPTVHATYNAAAQGPLTISTVDEQTDLNPATNFNGPRLLQSISGNFTIQTSVELSPDQQAGFQAAGILIWQDNSNFIRLERNSTTFDFEQVVAGVFTHDAPTDLASSTITGSQFELQIQRNGDLFTASWRQPGQNWQEINTATIHLQTIQVGLDLIGQGAPKTTATYNYFKVSCG